MLKLIEPSDSQLPYGTPQNARLIQFYYLGYGRNAWNARWVNRYVSRSVSSQKSELIIFAEKIRSQGSVLKIQSVPALMIEYQSRILILLAINERDKYLYDQLIHRLMPEKFPRIIWKEVPSIESNWLLIFELLNESGKLILDFIPVQYQAISMGIGKKLGWKIVDPIPFPNFLKFQQELKDRFIADRDINT